MAQSGPFDQSVANLRRTIRSRCQPAPMTLADPARSRAEDGWNTYCRKGQSCQDLHLQPQQLLIDTTTGDSYWQFRPRQLRQARISACCATISPEPKKPA